MSSKLQVTVFIETNLDTRIAIPVSPDITAGNFKEELERAHIDCFPELGFLSINAVMVKRNSYLYHLPDQLPLKLVFNGFENSWFLYVNASLPKKRKKKRRKRVPVVKKLPESHIHERPKKESIYQKGCYSTGPQEVVHLSEVSKSKIRTESPCESLSGVVSVSGIINRYFTNSFEINKNENTVDSGVTLKIGQYDSEKNNKEKHSVKTSMNKYERSEVGRRLVVASENLESSQKSTLTKGKKKLWGRDVGSVIRNLVFEVNDSD